MRPALCHLLCGSVLHSVVDPHFSVCTSCGQPLAAPGDREDRAGGIVQGADQGWVLETWHELDMMTHHWPIIKISKFTVVFTVLQFT